MSLGLEMALHVAHAKLKFFLSDLKTAGRERKQSEEPGVLLACTSSLPNLRTRLPRLLAEKMCALSGWQFAWSFAGTETRSIHSVILRVCLPVTNSAVASRGKNGNGCHR